MLAQHPGAATNPLIHYPIIPLLRFLHRSRFRKLLLRDTVQNELHDTNE
jgi:hypothetical protein